MGDSSQLYGSAWNAMLQQLNQERAAQSQQSYLQYMNARLMHGIGYNPREPPPITLTTTAAANDDPVCWLKQRVEEICWHAA